MLSMGAFADKQTIKIDGQDCQRLPLMETTSFFSIQIIHLN